MPLDFVQVRAVVDLVLHNDSASFESPLVLFVRVAECFRQHLKILETAHYSLHLATHLAHESMNVWVVS